MSDLPFRFLSALPVQPAAVPSLSEIQLSCDNRQRLLLALGRFSLAAYRPADYATLQLELPAAVAGAVPKRQAEYLAGRYLSRLVMQQSGLFGPQPPQLGSGLLRAPDWPQRVTGSVSHHQNRACAVLLTEPLAADNFTGVDLELWLTAQQASDIGASIHRPTEQALLQRAGFTAAQATTLLFSAKEALFKAICPFVRQYFGFDAAELRQCSAQLAESCVAGTAGWLELRLTSAWVAASSPQQSYRCWFSCSELDVLTLVCSEAVSAQW